MATTSLERLASAGVEVSAVTSDMLAWKGSAQEALEQLSVAQSVQELLHRAHALWCGHDCDQSPACTFLYYLRTPPAAARPSTVRPRYNKQTAHLYAVMGEGGYVGRVPQTHQVKVWPLLDAVVERWDAAARRHGGLPEHYADWTKKRDAHAADTVSRACRDTIQWTACWCGERYGVDPLGLRYVAFATILDDICIPPLDLVGGRFRMYGWSVRDLMRAMDTADWGRDGVHALLSLIRQSILQYAEKMDFHPGAEHLGLHTELNGSTNMWDGVIFRGHTGNAYGTAITVARNSRVGPLSFTWLMDSAICDCLSMDLCKSAIGVYSADNHQPTSHKDRSADKKASYRSIYLDLIDDLVFSGAPEPLVQFGSSGFLFVPIQDRYQERRLGRRFPISPPMARELKRLFGETPTDAWLDEVFHCDRDHFPAIPPPGHCR
ncbi:hypothetical protein [Streptomyces orinoci]|uniref:Uncharacterized protein n=1 Tax=Streptomyces orinoci TaxID=67339 RepID=A0ABV3JZY8_STRON|nr:hypothetical protein [Streptomyces orinoci]